MQLTEEKSARLSQLLNDKKIDIPDFRRTVSSTGANYTWLQKHIKTRNPNLSPEILKLLNLS